MCSIYNPMDLNVRSYVLGGAACAKKERIMLQEHVEGNHAVSMAECEGKFKRVRLGLDNKQLRTMRALFDSTRHLGVFHLETILDIGYADSSLSHKQRGLGPKVPKTENPSGSSTLNPNEITSLH
ncbi:uncharacterized protein [Fopius arisanus]|uniref:Uncharacterized protein n=1 Tax=Fopius arisanus TaxID=64838 RepID=A0A9R1TKI6_9HYME|nr:PREDICTED: uncharacterized protein LOC105271019 [Fopius arisanus]